MPQIQVFLADGEQLSRDLNEDTVTVGRLADNHLQIDDGSVSSHHAKIVHEDGKYRLVDLDSTNGTFVNEEQITEKLLKAGDDVRFGRVSALYTAEEEGGVSQPLPESSGLIAEAASRSSRPANFVSTSPVPRLKKGKDIGGIALYALAVIAFIACGAAAYFVSVLQAAG